MADWNNDRSLLLRLPCAVLVRVLANLGHGSLLRVARSCAALSQHDLIDSAAKAAVERFPPELRACTPRTGRRRWLHIFEELEVLATRSLMFSAARSTVLELSPRAERINCWLGPGSALASRGVPMRAGVHSAELTVDPGDLTDGRSVTMDFGLARKDELWDADIAPFVPAQRYAVRLLDGAACSFAVDGGKDSGGLIQPLQRMQSLARLQPGERLRLRADLSFQPDKSGSLGVYRNDSWCGLVQPEVPPGEYEWFVTFWSVGSADIC